ncbi:hypothetical protein DH2020_014720 [Rehmannia glutinosa]|uniref:RBR-type E3 ubiquitin transferase n=2 Tax=Rehmannia glutinosa TaxID=99300 RepID=A0ABR0X160_REHGL
MATEVLEIVNVPDSAADDDEISVLYSTPVSVKKGTSKSDAIPVENYTLKPKRLMIDLSKDFSYLDDDVKLLYSFPKPRKRVFKGECSNSKSAQNPESIITPLTFMCEICADEKPTNDLFRVLGCDHSYCSDCMGKYVASKLQDNITAINCPVSGCNGFLEPQHCRSILPKQVFDRWGDALCEAVILASERFYCPFKDCSALLIDERMGGNDVIVQSECPDCNRLFCVQCKVPWHSGIECAEFQKLKKDERSNEDIMLMNLAKSKNWMRCPKCRFYVEKSEGCLFMKCRYRPFRNNQAIGIVRHFTYAFVN